jgi:hypothetical protein
LDFNYAGADEFGAFPSTSPVLTDSTWLMQAHVKNDGISFVFSNCIEHESVSEITVWKLMELELKCEKVGR